MNLVHRHQSLRRKKKIRAVVRSKRLIRGVDILVYLMTSCSLLFTFDQIWIIWVDHNAEGVSLTTWGVYILSSATWLCYGLLHKEKVIIFSNALWVCVNITVALGILIYHS